jgi:hypothetical protein
MGESGYGRVRGAEGLLDMTQTRVISYPRFFTLPREIIWFPYSPLKVNLFRRAVTFIHAGTLREKLNALFR